MTRRAHGQHRRSAGVLERTALAVGPAPVLPPQPHAPEEDLVSLIYFYEANHDAVVTPLAPPVGKVSGLVPVTTAAFIKERLDAITVA